MIQPWLREVSHWEQDVRVSNLKPLPVLSICFLRALEDVPLHSWSCHQTCARWEVPCYDGLYPSGTTIPNKVFYKLCYAFIITEQLLIKECCYYHGIWYASKFPTIQYVLNSWNYISYLLLLFPTSLRSILALLF